jgi:hypothetical protein
MGMGNWELGMGNGELGIIFIRHALLPSPLITNNAKSA